MAWESTSFMKSPSRSGAGRLTSFKRLMGFRTCYDKIWHLGILNISSWGNMRNGMSRKDFLPVLWSRSYNPHVRGALPLPKGKKHPYLWREWTQRGISMTPVSHTWLILFTLPLSMTFHTSSNPAKKHSDLISSDLLSLGRLLCHVNLLLNKCIPFLLLTCL